MIELKTPYYSLVDVYRHLLKINSHLVRGVTQLELKQILGFHPLNNEPAYLAVEVFLTIKKDIKIQLLHSNLGYLYFNKGDVLENFKLDKKKFYFDFQVSNNTQISHRDEIKFSSTGHTNWKATFDYEEIFDHFGLAGNDDFAPFVGFYTLKD
jgi:hypothetical protein